jgi:hypothetical protein
MRYDQHTARALYRRLIAFYPGGFKEQLGESLEQTFDDLCNEKRQSKRAWLGFVLWIFIETAMGIFREHLLLLSSGVIMQTTLKTIGSPALVSLLLISPFIFMEVVNRRNFNEGFPFVLFSGLWLDLFAISLILLPMIRARRTGNQVPANPVPTQGNTPLTTPKPAVMIGIVMVLSAVVLFMSVTPGGEGTERLFNDSNPEGLYALGIRVTGRFAALVLFSLPIAAGTIAGRPIVRTLQAGGSLLAHPIHLVIVVSISFLFAAGAAGLIADQWPCFMGVPNCD